MSKPHLRFLETALVRKGWRIVTAHPGNNYDIAAAWEIRRGASAPSLFIDFYGLSLDGDGCLPFEESYGCKLRGRSLAYLYFRRVNKSRRLWEQDVAQFVQALDGA